jgi:hypothetical protein
MGEPIQKISKAKKGWGRGLSSKHLLGKHQILSSNPSNNNKKQNRIFTRWKSNMGYVCLYSAQSAFIRMSLFPGGYLINLIKNEVCT